MDQGSVETKELFALVVGFRCTLMRRIRFYPQNWNLFAGFQEFSEIMTFHQNDVIFDTRTDFLIGIHNQILTLSLDSNSLASVQNIYSGPWLKSI